MQIRNFLCEYRNGCVFEVGYNFQLFFSTPYGLFAYFPALNCIYFIVYCCVLLPVCSTLILFISFELCLFSGFFRHVVTCLSLSMSQIRGSCGHLKASWDNHLSCFSCSGCSFANRCSTCKKWTSAVWTLVACRRTHMGRRKTTDEKKRDNEPGDQETVIPSVEGHSGSGTSKKSQSETLSSTDKSSSGGKYRENRENSLTDTHRSKVSSPDRSGSSATVVSKDKRAQSSPGHLTGNSDRTSRSPVNQAPVTRSPGSRQPGVQSPDHQRTRHRSEDRQNARYRSPVHKDTRHRSPGHQTTRYRSDSGSPCYTSSNGRSLSSDNHSRSDIDDRRVDQSSKHQSTGHRSKRPKQVRDCRPTFRSSRSKYSHTSRRSRSSSSDLSRSRSSSYSSSSGRDRHHKRKHSYRRKPHSGHKRHKKHKYSSSSRHRRSESRSLRSRGRKRSRSITPRSHRKRIRVSSTSGSVSSDRDDTLSLNVEHNDFDGDSIAGSPTKINCKSKKQSSEKHGSDSNGEEEPTVSFADAIKEVMALLPPDVCPRKESSDFSHKPRSTLDALNPSDDKDSASLPQSLLIKDTVNLFQDLISKKIKLEPGWVTNQSIEKDLGVSMKYYRTHGQLFPAVIPKLDKDASLLDLYSSGNTNIPIKSLETMERQARNMVTINSYADLFAAASVKSLESDDLDALLLKRMLNTLVNCIKHSTSMAVILAVELLQARREAAIEKSKILIDASKDKLRSVSISAESMFGGQVTEIQKSNAEAQQQKFIASSLNKNTKPANSDSFKIPKRPAKKHDQKGSANSRQPIQRDKGGSRRGSRRGGTNARGRSHQAPSRGGASNVSSQ